VRTNTKGHRQTNKANRRVWDGGVGVCMLCALVACTLCARVAQHVVVHPPPCALMQDAHACAHVNMSQATAC
jgi:hypothetical protein